MHVVWQLFLTFPSSFQADDTLALNARVSELEDILARCCRLHNQERFGELGTLLATVAEASAALGKMVGASPEAGIGGELERALRQSQERSKVGPVLCIGWRKLCRGKSGWIFVNVF